METSDERYAQQSEAIYRANRTVPAWAFWTMTGLAGIAVAVAFIFAVQVIR